MHVTFDCPNELDLAAEFRKPVRRLAVQMLPHGEIASVELVREKNVALSISNVMADLAPRAEIGRLRFEIVPFNVEGKTVYDDVFVSSGKFDLYKLVLADADLDVTADSGVLFRDSAGLELLIAPAAFPNTLMLSMTGIGEIGDLECGMEHYRLAPI